ncbi:hypothetical protein D9613_002870 [Agrocybe pediades]|uniref:Uncharacterized protein n=1 Tax=Agrocybe pediades TaxID=84607 RepID=A0A8H4QPV7_9AGAR|nr:hypothetical protein D9613_002870 [Agrocybe pediades]
MAEDSSNALGLDFSELKIEDPPANVDEQSTQAISPSTPSVEPSARKEKSKPYVNPERVKTGGSQRDKLSEEALQERMARIREQNEKIKQRRLDVLADEDAFRKTQEIERAKQAQNRKVQSEIDRARDQNARRKMEKVQSREWDSGKPAADRSRQHSNRSIHDSSGQQETGPDDAAPESNADSGSGSWSRGGHLPHPRGRGRGRGRGSGNRGGNAGYRERRNQAPATEPSPADEAIASEDNTPSAL